MEESKSKEVKMKASANEDKKYTYEELNTLCTQLYRQNQALLGQLREQKIDSMLRRLDYLLKIIELASSDKNRFSNEFIANCIKEIEDTITIPEQEEGKEN